MRSPEINTPRLLLRVPDERDFPGWRVFHADAITMQHLGGVQDEADAWRSLAGMVGVWQLRSFGMFSVIDRASGRWAGRVGPWEPHLWPVQEVGWGIARCFEGRGYALEAAVASIDYAFHELGWARVSHLIAAENDRSLRLAKRLGAERIGEARLPGRLSAYRVDEWGQSRDDWWARRCVFDGIVPR